MPETTEDIAKTRLESALRKKKITEKNYNLLIMFDRENKVNGLAEKSRYFQNQILIKFANKINKNYTEMTRDDILKFFSESKYSKYSLEIIKAVVKKFFKYLNGGKEYPDIVSGLGRSKNAYKHKEPKDMLNEQQINQLVDACDNLRDRTMIRLLWDTAIRVGELCSLNFEDVTDDGNHIKITVHGKTGSRTVGLTSSAPLVRQLLNLHKQDKEAPLFICHNHKNYGARLTENTVLEILQSRKDRAKIEKRVTPHIIRHSRLTYLAVKGLTEPLLRQFAGWERNSSMVAYYVNLTDEKVNNKILEIDIGIQSKPKDADKSSMLPIQCPRCKTRNDANSNFCINCWSPLQQEVMQRDINLLEMLRSRFLQFEGIDVDKILRDYQNFKMDVSDMEKILQCFNGQNEISNDIIQKALMLNTEECLNLLQYLVTAELIKMEDDRVILKNKTKYQQFLQMQKRYLEPV